MQNSSLTKRRTKPFSYWLGIFAVLCQLVLPVVPAVASVDGGEREVICLATGGTYIVSLVTGKEVDPQRGAMPACEICVICQTVASQNGSLISEKISFV